MDRIYLFALQAAFVPIAAPFFIGLTRRVKAIFQDRKGASPFQPYRDLWKLFHKDEVISKDASWVSRYAPYLIFGSLLSVGAAIPVFSDAGFSLFGDFLAMIYLLAFGTFFLALAGLDAGGGFGGFGASREMLVSALSEGGLIFSLFALAVAARTTNLAGIARGIAGVSFTDFTPIIIAFVGFFIALLAETMRYPFDNPATHLELTMIHEAMILEFSGKRLALLEWASGMKYLIFILLGVNLFFPWGLYGGFGPALVVSAIVVFLKATVLAVVVAIIESTMAKMRIFRLPDLLFTSFVISIIAIGLLV